MKPYFIWFYMNVGDRPVGIRMSCQILCVGTYLQAMFPSFIY